MKPGLICPACRLRIPLQGKEPGTSFSCACGNKLPVPAGMQPGRSVWGCLALALVTLGIPFAIFTMLDHGDSIPLVDSMTRAEWDDRTETVRETLTELCNREHDYHQRTGKWLAAGPSPAAIPEAEAAFDPDAGFAAVGFSPGKTPFQYAVVPAGKPGDDYALCVARGFLGEKAGIPWTLVFASNDRNPAYSSDDDDSPPDVYDYED